MDRTAWVRDERPPSSSCGTTRHIAAEVTQKVKMAIGIIRPLQKVEAAGK